MLHFCCLALFVAVSDLVYQHIFSENSFFPPLNLEHVLRKFSGRKAIFQENIKNDVSQFLETISLKKNKTRIVCGFENIVLRSVPKEDMNND